MNPFVNETSPRLHINFILFAALPTFVIVVGTVAGNLLVIVAIFHNRQLRKNITNGFCASLAISDLLLGILVLPLSFIKLVTGTWNLGSIVCNLYVSTDVFLSTASILNLFIVSIDRYYAITCPLLYRSIITKKAAIWMLAIVWLLSVVIAFLPIYLGWNTASGRIQNVDDPKVCMFAVDNLLYSLIIGIGTYYIPLLILYLMYTKILKISYGHVKAIRAQTHMTDFVVQPVKHDIPHPDRRRSRSNSHSHHHTLRQHRATLTLFIIVGAFTLCWLPYFTLFTVHPLYVFQVDPIVEEVFLWMGYFNSFVNPFVYGMTNREYRIAFRRILCDSWKCGSKMSPAHTRYDSDLICM